MENIGQDEHGKSVYECPFCDKVFRIDMNSDEVHEEFFRDDADNPSCIECGRK